MFDASSKIHEAVEQLSRQKSALRLNAIHSATISIDLDAGNIEIKRIK